MGKQALSAQLEGQLDFIEGVPIARGARPKKIQPVKAPSVWAETTVQQKCHDCLTTLAADPTAPAAKMAHLRYRIPGLPERFLCRLHATDRGWTERKKGRKRKKDQR